MIGSKLWQCINLKVCYLKGGGFANWQIGSFTKQAEQYIFLICCVVVFSVLSAYCTTAFICFLRAKTSIQPPFWAFTMVVKFQNNTRFVKLIFTGILCKNVSIICMMKREFLNKNCVVVKFRYSIFAI